MSGAVPPYIYRDIGGVDRFVWFVSSSILATFFTMMLIKKTYQALANLLGLAGICPFVGSLSDLIGRRWVAIVGASLVCIGVIISSTAQHMNTFIGMFYTPVPSLVYTF